MVISILAIGCHADHQPAAVPALPSGPIAEPSVPKARAIPTADTSTHLVESDRGPIDAERAARVAEQFVRYKGHTIYDPPIDAARAVKIAEQFVRENGYTDYVPPDSGGLVLEALERSEQRDMWIKLRRNTLRPRALGYLEGARNDDNGWTVGFEYVEPSDLGAGRAVTMDARGGSVRMQHVDFILKHLKPRPE
jgi:hypothetical protein